MASQGAVAHAERTEEARKNHRSRGGRIGVKQMGRFDPKKEDDRKGDDVHYVDSEFAIEYEVPPEAPPQRPPTHNNNSSSSSSTERLKYGDRVRASDRIRNNMRLSSMLEGRGSSTRGSSRGGGSKGSKGGGSKGSRGGSKAASEQEDASLDASNRSDQPSVASSAENSHTSSMRRRQTLLSRMKSLSTRSMSSVERQRVMGGASDGIQRTTPSVASVPEHSSYNSSGRKRRSKEELRRSVRQQRLQRILSRRSDRRPPRADSSKTGDPTDASDRTMTESSRQQQEDETKNKSSDTQVPSSSYPSKYDMSTIDLDPPDVAEIEEEKKEVEAIEITVGQLRYSTRRSSSPQRSASTTTFKPPSPPPTTKPSLSSSIHAHTTAAAAAPARGERPAIRRAASTSALLPQPPRSSLKKESTLKRESSVRFDRIELREFDRTIGDNPSVSCGIPIGLDWKYKSTTSTNLDEYEESRLANRRPKQQLALAPEKRQEMLLKDWGVTFRELHQMASATDNIKKQRFESAMQTPAKARVEEVLETTKRRVSRVIKGHSKKKEQELLWQHARRDSALLDMHYSNSRRTTRTWDDLDSSRERDMGRLQRARHDLDPLSKST